MHPLKEMKIKKTIDNLIKYEKDIRNKDLVIYLKKRINKEEFLFLLNDKEYCEKIISLSIYLYSHSIDGMWQGRAMVFMKHYINDLFNLPKYLLKKNIFELIKMNLSLDNVEEIINYFENKNQRCNLREYVAQLPAYQKKSTSPIGYEQHGYLIMQYTEYLNELEEAYNFNFNGQLNIRSFILADKLDNF